LRAAGLGTASRGAQLLQVGGGVAGGLLAFLGVALIFKMPELVLLKQMLTERLRRR
jgi:hypothetical protein